MMTLSFMRKLDDGLGMFLAGILGKATQLKKLFFRTQKHIEKKDVKVILLQKYFGMGSILNAIPLVKALQKNYPNAKIIFLTLETNREVIEACNIADEVITISFDSFGRFVKDSFRTLFYFMGKKIDILIDLEFFSKFTLIISFFSFSRIRMGLYHRRIRPEGILTHEIYYNSYKHISEIYFAFAESLRISSSPEYFANLLPSMKQTLEVKLREKFNLKNDKRIIIINANSSDLFDFRSWPAKYFVELGKLLLREHPDYYYLLIGGNGDCKNVSGIFNEIGANVNLINVCGKTSIKELFALIEMAELFITNDSGPLHIASLYGKNIVTFFGPETPIVYGPLNENSLIFYSQDLYCSPCLSVYDSKKSLYVEKCRENICLLKFDPNAVYEKIRMRFLGANRN